jgi:prevent-host-death family protein
MREIGARAAKNTWRTLLDRVQEGEEIVITRRGKPVARLAPYAGNMDRRQAQAASERIRTRARSLGPGAFRWDDLKADREAGRP